MEVDEDKVVKVPEVQEARAVPGNPLVLEYAHLKPCNAAAPGTPVLDYRPRRDKRKERRVSMAAFVLGFLAAIGVAAICFWLAGTVGDLPPSRADRVVVFAVVLAGAMGLIVAATLIGQNTFNGFGRGVATGFVLAMMALGPCAI